MDWLKQNYERAILILAAVILLACAGLIFLNVSKFPEQFSDRNSTKPKDNNIPPAPLQTLEDAANQVKNPRTWKGHEGSLFVSRPYVLKEGVLIDPLEGSINLHEPITNAWLIKYQLPYWEGDVRDQDPDQDRFSNLEEFRGGTDPTDAKSHPAYYTKLRLEKFLPKPFRLIFTGSPDDGQTFTINTKDKGGRTQFLQLNDMIEGNDGAKYKLLTYEPKKTEKNGIEVDASELVIQNTTTGQKIVLVANVLANDPTSYGKFINLYDNSEFTVKKDDEFTLNPEKDHKYKLIDISDAEAVIEDQVTREKIKISPVK